MTRRPILLLLAFALAAGQATRTEPIPDEDLMLRVTAGATEVEFGKAFSLTVVRVWSKELDPRDWNDGALAPLVVRLVDTARREDDRRVEETRRYQCYAFHREDLKVPAPSFKAKPRNGGAERVVSGEELRFRIKSALEPATPEPVELPGEPFEASFPWLLWSAGGGAALAALVLLFWYARRRASWSAVLQPVAPHLRALQRLQRLREQQPHGRDEIRADSVEASSLVRAYIEDQFSVPAPEMTTEEFLGAAQTERALQALHREMLTDFLAYCDRVKFACHAPRATERQRQLSAVEAFVMQTRGGATA